jgi:hypothetical protein
MKDGEACSHKGCLSHISHPCEACGRIAGKTTKINDYQNQCDDDLFEFEDADEAWESVKSLLFDK